MGSDFAPNDRSGGPGRCRLTVCSAAQLLGRHVTAELARQVGERHGLQPDFARAGDRRQE